MKIEIRHLGVVNNATIELKPLTVFIGENGTGKTWTAYTLSAILGRYGCQKYLKAYLDGQTQTYPPLDNAIARLLDKGNMQIDLVQFASFYAEAYINDVARFALDWMPTFMATRRVTFEHLQVHVNLAEAKTVFLDKIMASAVNKKLSFDSLRNEALLTALKESGKATLYFYLKMAMTLVFSLLINELIIFSDHHLMSETQTGILNIIE
jgi:predicted ATPase